MSTETRILGVQIEYGDLLQWYRGFRMALFRRQPFEPERLPEGWYFPDRPWPIGSGKTRYWVHIWREAGKAGEHITIKASRRGGWWVDYDPENSWNGGFLLGPEFDTYERAVEVAIDAMERMEAGADYSDIRYDYD